ncbi:hypothetical protein [Novosphingobium terrae]|uniref:hypothetical protein n=1 Tax=Novosphingobium terrae TaxID=2726189 RepID=UPI00198112A2|nr:hypothetical protein [Novosphingobium terrae]
MIFRRHPFENNFVLLIFIRTIQFLRLDDRWIGINGMQECDSLNAMPLQLAKFMRLLFGQFDLDIAAFQQAFIQNGLKLIPNIKIDHGDVFGTECVGPPRDVIGRLKFRDSAHIIHRGPMRIYLAYCIEELSGTECIEVP